jgi:hypothetical protein
MSDESMPNCKGCSASVHVSEEEIRELVASLGLRPDERASDAVFLKRLAACDACEHLKLGTTCMQCGCLVRVRALIASSRCPAPSGNRWK